jgi:hypothetical protein
MNLNKSVQMKTVCVNCIGKIHDRRSKKNQEGRCSKRWKIKLYDHTCGARTHLLLSSDVYEVACRTMDGPNLN